MRPTRGDVLFVKSEGWYYWSPDLKCPRITDRALSIGDPVLVVRVDLTTTRVVILDTSGILKSVDAGAFAQD